MKKLGSVAIVGAGISGLSCGQLLQAAGVNVRIFERAAQAGGRCATQLWQGHLVDVGVQYFTAQNGGFKKELLNRLRQFRPIISPILDGDNQVISSPEGPRFYVLQGNNYFAHVLSRGLDMRLKTNVETVSFSSGITCLGDTYQAVVSCLPGPQSARLFNLSHSPVDYEPCLTALLEYAGVSLGQTRECYGRILPKNQSAILSSYCENHKAGRIVGNKTVYVVQASAHFSREYADAPTEAYLPQLIREHERLWHIPPGLCTASYGHRWLLARPQAGPRRRVDLPTGAFLCGDSCTNSTVEDVWLNGQQTANEVLVYLSGLSS